MSASLQETAPTSVLSPEEIEHFIHHGFVHLSACFDTAPGSTAHRWVQESWLRNGLDPEDRSTWPNDKIHMPGTERVLISEFSPKAYAAILQLCGGQDRIKPGGQWGNGFIANYGWGRDKEWIAPGPDAPGWHKDGDFFLHFLDSPEQALLVVVIFSDIHPQGGGTFIAPDSIAPVAQHLAAHPEGVRPGEFGFKEMIRQCQDFRETTARAGDVYLLHPYILHTSSYNHRPEARFMTNPCFSFLEPMRFDRRGDGSAYSPVELSVLRALGVEHYDFQPTAPRESIVPERLARQQKLLEEEQKRLAALAS